MHKSNSVYGEIEAMIKASQEKIESQVANVTVRMQAIVDDRLSD